jgi:hypothetical protein
VLFARAIAGLFCNGLKSVKLGANLVQDQMFQLRNAVLVKSEAMHAVSAGRKQRLKTVITFVGKALPVSIGNSGSPKELEVTCLASYIRGIK